MDLKIHLKFFLKEKVLQKVQVSLAENFSYQVVGNCDQKAMDKYFKGEKENFPFPLNFEGLTSFQVSVLKECQKILLGKTLSYSDLAVKLKRLKSFRAVANALGKNPFPFVIPCHRVISKTGALGGYTPDIRIKERLLEYEL